MVTPITQRNVTVTTPIYNYRLQQGWRQRRPIDRNLDYLTEIVEIVKKTGTTPDSGNWSDVIQNSYNGGELARNAAENRAKILAYDRFIGKMGDRAGWAINLAEMQQALYMMENRLLRIIQFLRYIRRGDIAGAAAALKVQIPTLKKGKNKNQQSLPEMYLEFHFGWSPLIGDIKSSVDILQSPIPDIASTGKGKDVYSFDSGNVPFTFRRIGAYEVFALYKAMFSVTNPNLYLANQLGLVNPAVVVWELVPYSFVVDWFVNVSQFMNQGSDLFGLTLKYPCTTGYHVGAGYGYWTHTNNPVSGKWFVHRRMSRLASISGPALGLRPQRLWHWRRVAAAASLVVNLLVDLGVK